MNVTKHTITIEGKEIVAQTGTLAPQAAGSVLVQMGGTTILATVTVDDRDSDLDYFPLGVEYIEKMYARGAISGSRFQKREGYPSDDAVIKARQVDHSIRSLFPKSFKKPTSVVLTIMTYDEENDPEDLAVLGASLALMQAGIPFMGPCASVVAAVDTNNQVVINPTIEERHSLEADFVVSAVDGKILNMEGWAKEVTEEVMDTIIDKSLEVIEALNTFQREFAEKTNAPTPNFDDYNDIPAPEAIVKHIKENYLDALTTAMFAGGKVERDEALSPVKEQITNELLDAESSPVTDENGEVYPAYEVSNALNYVERYILRQGVLNQDKRIMPRGLEEIRELHAEIDLLPVVHGSAYFSRGLTQSLSIATLAPLSYEMIMDDMNGESTKSFMHHYNMPNFSTGEAGRYNYRAGRREVGHGAIGENALKHMVPSTDDFPYTIRVVSEITSSNGSTSMAATCASSMALMAAGVPMKEAVAGIGIGLVTEDGNEDNYKILLDIEGTEDFYGDMDFKVCGTKNGITAIQYENKLRGVTPEILKESFRLAKTGRFQVLETMAGAIATPRQVLPANAPVVEKIMIKEDQIGELIGPGGKNIKALVEAAGEFGKSDADINIDDDGGVLISAANSEQLTYIKQRIEKMFEKAQMGAEYETVVDRIADFGIFVNVPETGITGLVHVSEIADKYIANVDNIFNEGDIVNVKVKGIEDGKVSMTMKGIDQPQAVIEKLEQVNDTPQDRPPRRDDRGGNRRNDRRGGGRRR